MKKEEKPKFLKVLPSVEIDKYMELGEITKPDSINMLNGVYLHGKLYLYYKYDVIIVLNTEDFEKTWYKAEPNNPNKPTDTKLVDVLTLNVPDGKYECEVLGYRHPCTAFIWHFDVGQNKIYRGLIVDNEDEEYYKDAEYQYEVQEFML